jgi:hypothetical protein
LPVPWPWIGCSMQIVCVVRARIIIQLFACSVVWFVVKAGG